MKIRALVFCVAISLWAQPAVAIEQRGDLSLIKEPAGDTFGGDVCSGIFDVHSGRDVANLRDFPHNNCEGEYTLILNGDKGQLVTIFGQDDHKLENGFMVIRKTDDRKVWLADLEGVPSGKWVKRKPTSDSGGVQIFYNAVPQFSQLISSVKWGKWWKGRSPQ